MVLENQGATLFSTCELDVFWMLFFISEAVASELDKVTVVCFSVSLD